MIFDTEIQEKYDVPWSSVADLMAGLMVTFLFIAIVFLGRVQKDTKKYTSLKAQIYHDLSKAFDKDLTKWNAEIDKDRLTVTFKEPNIYFEQFSANMKPKFREVLGEFFPRYVAVLYSSPLYQEYINEVRIEGHTSSEWKPHSTADEAYSRNLNLSQERSRNVLEFCRGLLGAGRALSSSGDVARLGWLTRHVVAVGLSSSRPVPLLDGGEDRERSRRVEFRIELKADTMIKEISK